MQNPAIFFTAPGKAELCDAGIRTPNDGEILVRTEFTAVSAGTEYACLVGMPNTSARQNFPVRLGYSGVSIVEETGAGVKNFKKGDRVLVYHLSLIHIYIRLKSTIFQKPLKNLNIE